MSITARTLGRARRGTCFSAATTCRPRAFYNTCMTRPPFADFSSLAIRELTAWIDGSVAWSAQLRDVLDEHLALAADKAGFDPDGAFEELGEYAGEVFGAALEDLCTRRFTSPPGNLVDDFLKKRGHRLPPLAKTYLEAMRDSAPCVYEVVSVTPGHGVTVRDLFLEGEPLDVIEIAASRQLAQWDRLAARVVMLGGKRVFTGVLVLLPGEKGKALLDELREALHDGFAGRTGGDHTGDALRREAIRALRGLSPRLGAVRIAQILEASRRPLPQLVNRDGDPIEFIEARYPLTRKQNDVVARLDAEPALRRAGARPAKWDWLGAASENLPGASEPGKSFALDTLVDGDARQVVLAGLALSGGRLVASVNSRRRLERVRALLEPLLAGLVGEPEIDAKSVDEMMAEKRDTSAPSRRTVPKHVERKVMKRFLDDHYRKWLDDTLPTLGGRTPREAAGDFGGRGQLVAILKDLENLEARRARDTGFGYDVLWLWRELGIEHLRR